jgi:hypothetical protein
MTRISIAVDADRQLFNGEPIDRCSRLHAAQVNLASTPWVQRCHRLGGSAFDVAQATLSVSRRAECRETAESANSVRIVRCSSRRRIGA